MAEDAQSASGNHDAAIDEGSAPPASRNRLAAALLVVTALLAINPLVALHLTRSGGEWLGMGLSQVRTPLVLAAALLQLLAPALLLTLLLAAVGAWRHRRWAAGVGWPALAAAAAVLIVGPLGAISLAWRLPAGAWLWSLVAIAAAWALLGVWRQGQPGGRSIIGWTAAAFTAVVAEITIAAALIGGLPGQPIDAFGPQVRLGEGSPAPFAAEPSPQNPHMAMFPFAGIHNDAAQTDLYPQELTVDPEQRSVRSFAAGGGCASLAWDSVGNLAAICVSDSVTAYILNSDTLDVLARYRISDRPISRDFLTDFGGGGYMYLNNRDEIITPTLNRTVLVLQQVREAPMAGGGADTDPEASIELRPRAEYDLSAALLPEEIPTSALPDSSGRIWFVGQDGTVGYIEPSTGAVVARQWPGEDIENSFATGADDDVYVVSSTALRRLRAEPGGVAVDWEAPYDAGEQRKPGQTSAASGTTPTLHGDGLVSIADNGETTHVDVFRQADGTRVCHIPVFPEGSGATENSLVAVGNDLLVENNYGYALFDVLGGHSTEPGLVRVRVDPAGSCDIAWRNDDIRIPSVVSKATAASGLALTYTKDDDLWGRDRWWITAVGLGDGGIVWQRAAGSGSARNNHYAAIYMGPRGGVFVGTVMGILALPPPDAPTASQPEGG